MFYRLFKLFIDFTNGPHWSTLAHSKYFCIALELSYLHSTLCYWEHGDAITRVYCWGRASPGIISSVIKGPRSEASSSSPTRLCARSVRDHLLERSFSPRIAGVTLSVPLFDFPIAAQIRHLMQRTGGEKYK